MATNWTNSVPLGQAGTGDAVIYGRNQAAQNFGVNLRNMRQQEVQQELMRQREAEKIAQSYRDNALAASEGQLWSSELGKLESQHLQEGAQYRASGFDIYNPNPNDAGQIEASQKYMADRRRIENLRNYRKGIEAQYNDYIKKFQSGEMGDYDPEDINKLNEFVTKSSIQENYNAGRTLPMLNKRFRPDEALKNVKPVIRKEQYVQGNQRVERSVVDTAATENVILGSILSAPGGDKYLSGITNGMDPRDLKSFPATIEDNKKDIISQYEGDPLFRERLAADAGIVSKDSPEFTQFVDTLARQRVDGKKKYDNFISTYIARSSGGVTQSESVLPDFTMENQQYKRRDQQRADERLQIARQTAARADNPASPATPPVAQSQTVPFGPTQTRNGQSYKPETEARNFVRFNSGVINVVGNDMIDLKKGKKVDQTKGATSKEVDLVSLGYFPFVKGSKSGMVAQRSYIEKNGDDSVEWKPMAQVRSKSPINVGGQSIMEELLVPAETIQGTMSGPNKKIYDAFLQSPRPGGASQPESQTPAAGNSNDPLGLGF